MKLETLLLLLLAIMVGGYAGWYLHDHNEKFPPSNPALEQTAAEPITSDGAMGTSRVRMPVPAHHPVSPPAKPAESVAAQPAELPFPRILDEGDAYLKKRLPQLIDNPKLRNLLALDYFIQKLVIIIDHLPEKNIPRPNLPILPPQPGFKTVGSGNQRRISQTNATRYYPYVALAEAIPDAALLHLYQGLYPLFQQAYRETTGNPNSHFNDRFIEVIDDLLQTPEPQEPIRVMLHIHRFRYVDKTLESRSEGQKILLRMGLENSRRIKKKLRQLRQGLIGNS